MESYISRYEFVRIFGSFLCTGFADVMLFDRFKIGAVVLLIFLIQLCVKKLRSHRISTGFQKWKCCQYDLKSPGSTDNWFHFLSEIH